MRERITLTDRWLNSKANQTGDRMQSDAGCRGLYYQIRGASRSWIYRYQLGGKARSMGLGSYPEIGLADARRLADDARRLVAQGVDPIEERDRLAREARAAKEQAEARAVTFQSFALQHVEAIGGSWVSRHREKWLYSINAHLLPLASLSLGDITTEHVISALKPLLDRPKAFKMTRQRLEALLDAATARGLRDGMNPARWKGHLSVLMPAPVKASEHHASMPWRDLPTLMAALSENKTTVASCLTFTILTACRIGEAIGARWSEIDLSAATWVIPAERMKMGRPHRVPLCRQALEVLQAIPRFEGEDRVFITNLNRLLHTDATRILLKQRLGFDYTVHGFRASFRTWCAESGVDRQAAELALAHDAGDNAVERAYYRTDLLEQRRSLMQNWADTVCRDPASNVLPFAGRLGEAV